MTDASPPMRWSMLRSSAHSFPHFAPSARAADRFYFAPQLSATDASGGGRSNGKSRTTYRYMDGGS